MLVSLHVKDLALIDETEVYFEEGLNILSGETGAGKSIIIGSIGLALGGKADKDLIRSGAEFALVELVFALRDEMQIAQVKAMELPIDEDGTVILQRRIMPSRSVCKVGGETVTLAQLRELSEILIDIHGQHEHQSLLKKSKHLDFLDSYSEKELAPVKGALETSYLEYIKWKKEFDEATLDDSNRDKDAALAAFEVEEIDNAALQPGEDEELEARYRKMVYGKRIAEGLHQVSLLTGTEEEGSIGDSLGRALHELKHVAEYDEKIADFENTLLDAEGIICDLHKELIAYLDDLEFDEEEFNEVEERLNLINRLKDKYGKTISQILEYREKQQAKCEKYADFDAYVKRVRKKYEESFDHYRKDCQVVHQIRVKKAKELSELMIKTCGDLNFLHVEFEVRVEETSVYTKQGYDSVTFYISTNPGEKCKELQEVASGGELSRIMLALKTILADQDAIDTLIFDEIDTGISGKTAWKVSEKMGLVARKHQVICITHLPQIAAMADHHFVISKSIKNQRTTTEIKALDQDAQLSELARMLGGEEMTEAVLMNAKDLKRMADEKKEAI